MKKYNLMTFFVLSTLLSACGQSLDSSSFTPTNESISGNTSSNSNFENSSLEGQIEKDINKVIEICSKAKTQSSHISSGEITEQFNCPDSDLLTYLNTTIYEYGEDKYGDVVHFYQKTQQEKVPHYYLMKSANGSIIEIENSEGFQDRISLTNYPEIGPIIYNRQYEKEYYGPENFLLSLLKKAQRNSNKDLEIHLQDSTYKISFGYLLPEWFRKINISFSLGQFNEISYLKIAINDYSYSFIQLDEKKQIIMVKDGALASESYEVVVNQKNGKRKFNNPYNLDELALTSYDIVNNDLILTSDSTLIIEQKKSTAIFLKNPLPTTANPKFDYLKVEIFGKNCDGLVNKNIYENLAGFDLRGIEIGTYAVTVKTINIAKTFRVQVIPPLS